MPISVRPRFTLTLPILTAVACAFIAGGSLIGWLFGIASLKSVAPGLPSMVPLTACLTLLAAATLALQQRAAAKSICRLAGLAVMTLSIIIMAVHGIREGSGAMVAIVGNAVPWTLPSPLTGALFLVIGTSLYALVSARNAVHAQWLALGILFVALLTLVGYLFLGTILYKLLPGTGTSILTALVMMLLAIGILGARPGDGLMAAVDGNSPGARIARQLLATAMALPAILGGIVWGALRLDLIDVDTGIALLAWGIAVTLVVVTWHCAMHLKRAETARQHAEQELEHALVSLREADVNKDKFLAVLAHELRNPLMPIRAAAELLGMSAGVDIARQRRTSDIILRQVGNISDLVEDLLDISSVRQGLINVDKVPVDLAVVVRDAIEQITSHIAQRGHTLETHVPGHAVVILGDHKRLVQVVANLLVNATKFTPNGGTIVVSVHADDAGASIEIVDNGLPDVDGLVAVRSLRNAVRRRACRIIALTGRNDPETQQRARQAGVDHFFAKGHDVAPLLALLDDDVA